MAFTYEHARPALTVDCVVFGIEVEKDVAHRAARLYRFDRAKYDELSAQGFLFEV
jgi:8-oxo-dGTP diphosphatase